MSSPESMNNAPGAGVGDSTEYDALNEKRFLAGVISYFRDKAGDKSTDDQGKHIMNSIKAYAKLTDEQVDWLAPQVNAVEVFVSSPLSMPKEPYKALLVDVESKPEPTDEEKRQADELKQKGNEQLKENKAREAVQSYTEALKFDGKNPILYCNRAAAFTKAESFMEAVDDCKIATLLDANYSKAYARMCTAYSSLKRFDEAKLAITKAIELEPDNDTYKNNLKIVEEEIEQTEKQRGDSVADLKENFGGQVQDFGDFMNLMNNPQFMGYAQDMMKTPEFQQRMATVMNAMMNGDASAVMSGMPPSGMAGLPPGMAGFPGTIPGMPMIPGMGGGPEGGGAGGYPDFQTAMLLGQQMFARNPQMMEELTQSMSSMMGSSSGAGDNTLGDLAGTTSSGGKSGTKSSSSNNGNSDSGAVHDSSTAEK